MDAPKYPMRINRYLALKGYATRRAADELIERGSVTINGKRAVLGSKVQESDRVEVRARAKHYSYFAYNKPRGTLTHSAKAHERDIAKSVGIANVFPIGRLDKDSHGLIILTDDGRVTERLLSPAHEHEKEYVVTVQEHLRNDFAPKMEHGVDIGGYTTRPCTIRTRGEKRFSITIKEGKKHQIRRMCAALGYTVTDLERIRIMRIHLGKLASGAIRKLDGTELAGFLRGLGLGTT